MNFQEALEYKNKAFTEAADEVKKFYHIIVAPKDVDESKEFIDLYLKNPEAYSDLSAKKFSSDGKFQVVSVKKE